MTLTLQNQKIKRLRPWIAVLAAAILLTGLALMLNRTKSVTGKDDPVIQVGDKSMSETDIMKDLEVAAAIAVEAQPVSGTIDERPGFVSEFEWHILKNVAGQRSGESAGELTNLINKLLFAKKREAWLASSGDAQQRRALAGQLLEMIPAQLRINALDVAEAKKFEGELRADLAHKPASPGR